ncbi:MAG: hypothetical protein KGH54_00440 [Candidatus Micrarchaeota archaeon]|nr:hypothetical protein [Candidatus Micrarchaeota archaeon]
MSFAQVNVSKNFELLKRNGIRDQEGRHWNVTEFLNPGAKTKDGLWNVEIYRVKSGREDGFAAIRTIMVDENTPNSRVIRRVEESLPEAEKNLDRSVLEMMTRMGFSKSDKDFYELIVMKAQCRSV